MTDHTPDGQPDERLRRLLDDAVSDVHPTPALSAIRNRTKVTPMNRHRSWLAAAAAAVAVSAATVTTVVLTGDDSGSPDRGGPASTADDVTPDATQDTGTVTDGGSASPEPSPGEPERQLAVAVYYVGETPAGPRLFREFHGLTSPDAREAIAEAALVEALDDTADDPDYRSPWSALDVTVGQVAMAGGTVTVDLTGDLHDRPAAVSEAEAEIAVQQLVHTVQAAYKRRVPVQLLLDGDRTDTVLGVPAAEPLTAGDPMEVQAPVWIIEPQEGASDSAFVVWGRGAFFEANVSWQLLDGERVVDEGFTTAKECCTLAEFSFGLEAPAPGDYTLRVYDADMSGGEGNGEAEDTKQLTFR
jgi:hypothetical protein